MSIATETPALTGSWVTDPTHSSVGFTVLYMGVAPFQGAFRDRSRRPSTSRASAASRRRRASTSTTPT